MGINNIIKTKLAFLKRRTSKHDQMLEKLDIILELIEVLRKREQIDIHSWIDRRSELQRISRRLKR